MMAMAANRRPSRSKFAQNFDFVKINFCLILASRR